MHGYIPIQYIHAYILFLVVLVIVNIVTYVPHDTIYDSIEIEYEIMNLIHNFFPSKGFF